MKISLNGKWNLRNKSGKTAIGCSVPGVNYQSLLEAGLIPDPFVGTNEKNVFGTALEDWVYSKSFYIDNDALNADCVFLHAEQLDTLADIYINGKLAARASNCHLPFDKNVKDFLKAGENSIEILFRSPVRYVRENQKKHPAPHNGNGQDGIVYIRKPQCHFGWDWGPVLPVSGISGDIYLDAVSTARIIGIKTAQKHSEGKVELEIECEIERFSPEKISVAAAVYAPDGNKLFETSLTENMLKSERGAALQNEIDIVRPENADFDNQAVYCAKKDILNPELWWTRDLSDKDKQPLYTLKIFVAGKGGLNKNADSSNGSELDGHTDLKNSKSDVSEISDGSTPIAEKTLKIGLRTITLSRAEDRFGRDFCFVLNGVRLFAKGADYIPPDSFITRFGETELSKLTEAIKFSNMNMIRVWGGGYYAPERLMDMCDENGILVWQDFAFACQPYPFFDKEFLNSVKKEAKAQIKRLRNRASLALWCGNNEIETMHMLWATRKKWIRWTDKFFYEILPELVLDTDGATPYIEGSPCGIAHNKGFDKDNVGDTHLWAVWHGLQPLTYYRKRNTRFCSEYGFESLPCQKTINYFADKKDYALNSPVFKAHQKCSSGNDKMAYYIASRFRLPSRFTDYIYLSQIAQSECVRDAAEHWRRNKGLSNGALFWQLNDCWPVASWASFDYFYRYKALQYTAKHFFAPVALSAYYDEKTKKVYVYALNDTLKNQKLDIKFYISEFNGKRVFESERQVLSEAGKSSLAMEFSLNTLPRGTKLNNIFAAARLFDCSNKIVGQANVLFTAEKNIAFRKSTIEKSVLLTGGKLIISLKSDCFARYVMLESSASDAPFSDNFFDMTAKDEVTVEQALDNETAKRLSGCSQNELNNVISVFSAADLSRSKSAAGDNLKRLRVLLKPINFASWLFMKIIPKPAGKTLLSAPGELEAKMKMKFPIESDE